ncbi:MAG: deoxyribose-phosphate aldolase [Muribaculaceae bacterium]|nr:deoxyribose-phosphate aldolase [Muribaculaceae bacterium]
MDRYKKVLEESRVPVDKDVIKTELDKIYEKIPELRNQETYTKIFNCIDLTTLNTDDSQDSVSAFVQRVNDFDNEYPQYPNVAAVCVFSNFAGVVRSVLEVTGVKIAVVAGGFPSGQTFTAVKVADAALAVAEGADEVDVVMNIGMLRDGNYEELCDELIEIKHSIKDAHMKVIIESGALKEPEQIRNASILALWSDADFIKTSTGKVYAGASPEAAYVMCCCIKEYYEKTGKKVGFKAAGGVRTTEDALKYYAIVKKVLGEEWLGNDLFRIGASSLANNILADMLDEETVKYF